MSPTRRVSVELIALLALWAVMYLPALFSHQPWHFDELRYLEVARQLGEYGDWLVPHINGEVYQEKPPFFFWCVVLVQRLVGDYLIAGHLTVALAVLGTALLVMHLGTLLFANRRVGAFGAALLLTFVFIHDIGTRVLLDPFFAALTTAGIVALLHAAVSECWKQRLFWTALAAAATTAACMTKGPVGVGVTLIGAAALGLVWRGRKEVSLTALLVSAAVAGALTLLWVYLAALQAGWWYWDRMVFRQTVGRAVGSWAHQKPWWMYLANLPRMLLPWVLLLPAAAWAAWRSRRVEGARAGLGLAAWFAALLTFFSAVSGKRMGYLAPLFPAAALFIAWGAHRLVFVPDNPGRRVLVRAPLMLLCALPFVAAAAALALGAAALMPLDGILTAELRADRLALPEATPLLAAAFAAALLAGGVRIRRVRETAPRALCATLFALALAAALIHLTVYPAMDKRLSPEPIAEFIRAHKAPSELLIMLNDHKDGRVNYYLNAQRHEVYRAAELDELADKPGRLWIVSLERQWDDDLTPRQKARFERVFAHRWAGSVTAIYAERD